jgi:hypothetical protein
MRTWQLSAGDPLTMRLAADARLTTTSYIDDQSWEIGFGNPDEPALAIQTRYGGRVGLLRIVPLWAIDSGNGKNRTVYETQAFATRPTLCNFAPNYARITAHLTPDLALIFEVWVMDSRAVGGRITLRNESNAPVTLTVNLIAQLIREGRVADIKLARMTDAAAGQSAEALQLGTIGNLHPALLLENAAGSVSPHLSASLTVAPNASAAVRWVHSAQATLLDSLHAAQQWLYQTDWDTAVAVINHVNSPLPDIQTGDDALDAMFGFAQQVTLRNMLTATDKLPYPSLVNARIPALGFSRSTDGHDQPPEWNGLSAAMLYMLAPTTAILSPDLARGLLRNAISVADEDGWIDDQPGLGGQRSGRLAMPILAAAAWAVYEITEDKHFLMEVFPPLHKFYDRWFGRDLDRDGDGIPEWPTIESSAFPDHPTFSRVRRGAANADSSKAEAPDLIAYLIGEGQSLQQMAHILNKSADTVIATRLAVLQERLSVLWDEEQGGFVSCDRETHRRATSISLFRGRGDQAFNTPTPLDPPNRLVVRTIGGTDHPPRAAIVIEGVNADGAAVSETIPAAAFAWQYGLGTAVSEQVYAHIHYAKFDGLSHVYSVEIDTIDLNRPALTNLLPLWAGATVTQAQPLVAAITDPARYGLAAGLPMCPADAPDDEPNQAVHLFWNVLITEGLLKRGFISEAADLIGRLLNTEVNALRHDRAFRALYDAATGAGLGNPDDLRGVFPLALFMRLIGVRVINTRRVWVGGKFPLNTPVTMTQHGVTITRRADGTTVQFSSGYTVTVDGTWQVVESSKNEREALPPIRQTPPAPEIPVPTTPIPDIAPAEPVPVTYKIPVRRGKDEA